MAFVSLPFFVGCESEEFTPLNYATLATNSKNISVNEDASESIEVILYTGNVTGNDRTFTINVDAASTLSSAAYSIPTTVVVPANTNEAVFSVDITGAGIDNAGDVLVLRLGQEEGLYRGNALTVNLTKLCDFVPVGSFNNTSGWFGAEFPVEVEAGAAANQYVVKNLFSDGTDITFTVNNDLSITIPMQNSFVDPTYGQASVTGQAGSKIEPCLGKVTLALKHTVEAGSFGTFSEVLTVGTDEGGQPGGETEGEGEESEE